MGEMHCRQASSRCWSELRSCECTCAGCSSERKAHFIATTGGWPASSESKPMTKAELDRAIEICEERAKWPWDACGPLGRQTMQRIFTERAAWLREYAKRHYG